MERGDIKLAYPWNLAAEILDSREDALKIDPEALIGVIVDSGRLTDRERAVLRDRYIDRLTLEQTGRRFNVTRERIRQIEAKAIRKMRHPELVRRWKYPPMDNIKVWRDAYDVLIRIGQVAQRYLDTVEPEPELVQVPDGDAELAGPDEDRDIADLELSVRSYNCLIRGGIRTYGDLADTPYRKLCRIRNLGRKSLDEVLAKAKEAGIEILMDKTGDENA